MIELAALSFIIVLLITFAPHFFGALVPFLVIGGVYALLKYGTMSGRGGGC